MKRLIYHMSFVAGCFDGKHWSFERTSWIHPNSWDCEYAVW